MKSMYALTVCDCPWRRVGAEERATSGSEAGSREKGGPLYPQAASVPADSRIIAFQDHAAPSQNTASE